MTRAGDSGPRPLLHGRATRQAVAHHAADHLARTTPFATCCRNEAVSGDGDLRVPAAALPFVALGGTAIVAGGLVAAVTGPTGFDEGSWLAAYLVLVGGVALIALGVGQASFAARSPSRPTVVGQLAAWSLSTAAVVAGTLASVPVLTAVGGAVLVAVLVTFVTSVRGSGTSGRLVWLYRGTILLLLVSIPIGLVLAWQRHG